jgi:hypothetical protein
MSKSQTTAAASRRNNFSRSSTVVCRLTPVRNTYRFTKVGVVSNLGSHSEQEAEKDPSMTILQKRRFQNQRKEQLARRRENETINKI